ncbi:hypothetical protein [Listeria aquatica]|uniref:hypothetical protein n=1 Tax=Listeria aquatica TaxID=1494960 RepID=UPI001FD326CB|nr:hypothetical protein [Listeria aquatica]
MQQEITEITIFLPTKMEVRLIEKKNINHYTKFPTRNWKCGQSDEGNLPSFK